MSGKSVLVFYIVVAMTSAAYSQTLSGPPHNKVVVCYVASWAVYRTATGNFNIDDLEASLCTHLVYAFAGLDENTYTIKSLDPRKDLEKDYGKAGYKRMVNLKERYPHLKVTIAIGGWNQGSERYSKMAASAENRAVFIKSVLLFLETHKFDGLDFDWEYPTKRDGQHYDKANFVTLVKELKDAFEPRGYILTAALSAGKKTIEAAYDLTKLSRYLDLIHMMCYVYHGSWNGVVGANAPIRGSHQEDVHNVEYTIKYMLAHGVSPYKLVLGMPLYGRTFLLQDPEVKEIKFGRTPTIKNVGFPGPLTKEKLTMDYNEICVELNNASSKWSQHWHNQSETPYLRDGERVVSYDNARSLANKVKLAIDYGLGGFMVWSIDKDDFRGVCKRETDAYIDFVNRYNEIVDDPVLQEALKTLKLPDANRQTLSKRSSYAVSNNRLQLRLPEPEYSNYNLMRTINEAAILAIEENRITDEMARITKENMVEKSSPGGVGGLSSSVLVIMGCVFGLLSLF